MVENTIDPEIQLYNDTIDINTLPMFTRPDLTAYDGVCKPQIYLAIRGFVYDVTPNAKNYGPGKSYHKLVGKDATRLLGINKLVLPANQTGVDTWSTDDLTEKQHLSIDKWVDFFKKRYKVVGIVVGHE